ncbi:hypothetical protein H9Y04_13230 [Streptomyces sp. TRM66268-LWL]|uniref:DUF624 domain-containing protein n=1 Tax=Streptomyces polyasparticus TaxID=2767826 RepID=A0ABR7SGU1_9ACTN|nr:hypothetical protein [Streptomyces polyasparticus]MBC9713533.1 hypothetical protein [Streptomyces polyasparticus]
MSVTSTRAARAGRGESAFQRGLAVFAECLLTGVWIFLAALPLVTLPAAVAAGAAHLRRHLRHEASGWRQFTADWRTAVRRGWLAGLAGWAGLALVWADLAVVRAGLPGGAFVGTVGVLAALVAVVAALRAAVSWEPGASWRVLFAAAARRTVLDPAGSAVLVCGFAVIAASAWFAAPLLAPALGIVTAAALAVERRRAA